ncbi:Hpt domain-containing protein [Xanthomonas fragariae]|uniref:Hpt domain-containing protein n=1 Tax=Xanthomonas fragariae TaxID=48664 RepID=UPI0022AA8025|nr:Hpt domain-containing protein [Xanthomonas fragariae]WAT14156.1 Hpt domain-containing protein [Xanthomonas fragariae]
MSALRDAMSHAALGWVKPELDETLRQARNEIEYFAEEPSDTSRMRFCVGYLHQVQGTLRMVELYAPAMVAEELELLAQAVQVGEVADRDEACAMLMRGTVLLPDYLERLQNGHRDIPIVLLPLLNEIRATRGQPGLNKSVLFAFDPQAGVATEAELNHARGSLSGRNRELLDTVGNAVKEELLRVKDALDLHLRTGGDIAELQTQVKDLGSVADTLGMMGLGVARNVVVQQRDALARVVGGQMQMDEGVLLDIAGALLYVDAALDDQVASLGADVGDGNEASSSADSAQMRRTVDVLAREAIANFGAAREHFVAFIETNWDHARLSDVPHLLGEVGGALRILELPQAADYLEGVRRYVDLELIGKQRVPSGRQLDTLADAMASLEYYLEALRERRPGREEILDITRNSLETLRYWPLPSGRSSELPVGADQPDTVVEPQPVAGSLVQHAATPGAAANDAAPTPSLQWANQTLVEAPFAASVVHDTGAAAADTVFSFDPVAAEETVSGQAHVPFTVAPLDLSDDGTQAPGDWQLKTTEQAAPFATSAFDPVSTEQDGNVPADAAQVSYSVDLSALEQDEVATPVAADEAPLQIERIDVHGDANQTEVPLDFIAETAIGHAQTGIEDAFSPSSLPPISSQELDDPFVESAPDPQHALAEKAPEQSTPRVQQAVVSAFELDDASAAFLAQLDAAAAQFDVERPRAPLTTDADADAESAQAAPVQAASEPVPASADAGIFGGFGDSDIDDDIREVFLEEFDEELVNLGQLLPVWRASPNSPEKLRPIRRVFHTLKGSGRLVGAHMLGEFSWKIESMLNRVLDNSRPASPAVVAAVELAYEVLPQFTAALRDQGRISADLPEIQAVAERVAAGEEIYYVPATATPVSADAVVIPAAAGMFAASGGTPASVDSVLREILEAEVAAHLDTVNAWLQATQAEPQLATEELLRAVHTMSGAFAMTDVPEITLVTTPAESYLKRLLAASVTPSAEGVEAIAATAAAIVTTVTALRADAPMIPSFAALTERLRALVDTLPKAQWPPQVFPDELDDPDAPSDVAVGNNAAIELTGAQDRSSYLDASAQLSDAAVPTHGADQAQPQHAKAPSAEDAQVAMTEDWTPETAALDSVSTDQDGHSGDQQAEHADAAALYEHAAVAAQEQPADEQAHSGQAQSDGRSHEQAVEAEPTDAEHTAEALPDDTIESVQTFEMAQVADQVEDTGDRQSETATELHAETGVATGADVQHGDAHASLEATAATDQVEHAEHIRQSEPATEHQDTAAAAFSAPVEEAAPVDTTANDAGAAFDTGPLNFDQLDGELVDIFVEEGRDLLDHCDGLIARMREVQDDRDVLNGLQRDLHTLKGGARMAGINAIGDLGHAIESLLEAVAANRTDIDRDDVRLFERGFDRLHQLLTRTGMHRAVAMPTDLVEAFETRTRGRNAAPPSDADVRAIAKASVEPAPLSAPIPVEGQTEEDVLPRVQQQQVRVRADLLDRLVNHAGEVAIYRSRLEQQLGAFRGAMGELDRTNARLRDQLRRLDLETEAQIVARYQREQDQGDRTFDPLELDRFSTLQQLSRALNESAADLSGLQGVLENLSRQYDGLLQQQSRVSSELQDGLLRTRMVPFDGLVPRLRRVVRQAASDTGKQVHLLLEGTQGELDRNVLDRMIAPLEHMLRNSVAHGLETPEQRRSAGKPEEGSIAIRLRREGSEIVLEVADDGAGLDREAIRRRGEQRGLIEPGQALGDAELDSLIFASGFSTSEQVSQLSGRGVGMDVVGNEVRQLGGSVDIRSVHGQGVTFTLRLPQTLAVTQAVFVRIGGTMFAVPVGSVSGIGHISRIRYESGQGGYHYAGEEYVLHDLGSLVGQAGASADGQAQVPLLLVRAGDLRAAVAIDQVLGNREIVVKPVGLQIASVPGIYGATITGDGSVVVILDIAPLVRRYLAQPARPALETKAESQRQVPLVMVVDDSLTMRKVTSRVLERHNLDITTARDGVEAMKLLEERVPDLMLLDIEMPRMDGYELATAMRADPRFKAVPIMMITSRSGEKHRQRAFEIGVQRYLGKPYQELDLMRNVYDLLGIARVRE